MPEEFPLEELEGAGNFNARGLRASRLFQAFKGGPKDKLSAEDLSFLERNKNLNEKEFLKKIDTEIL